MVEPFDAVQLVRKCIKEGCRDTAANKLVDLAIEQRSMDNISILVIFFDFNGVTNTCTTTAASSSNSTANHIVVNENGNVDSPKTDGAGECDQKLENGITVEHLATGQDKESSSRLNGDAKAL